MKNMIASLSPSATKMIRMDHTHVLATFHKYRVDTPPEQKRALVNTICLALEIHAQLEEEIFYPAVRAKVKDDDLMNEALVEHNSLKMLIGELEKMQGDDPMLKSTVTVLEEYVKHHVREEESEILPKAKRLKLDLAGLAEQMSARKDELKARL